MRARDIKGKTVARVVQRRAITDYGKTVYDVHSLEFTDGTSLVLSVLCTEDDYLIDGTVAKPWHAPE